MAHWGHNTKLFCPHLVMCDCCTGNDFFCFGSILWMLMNLCLFYGSPNHSHLSRQLPQTIHLRHGFIRSVTIRIELCVDSSQQKINHKIWEKQHDGKKQSSHLSQSGRCANFRLGTDTNEAFGMTILFIWNCLRSWSVVLPFLLIELNLSVQGWS